MIVEDGKITSAKFLSGDELKCVISNSLKIQQQDMGNSVLVLSCCHFQVKIYKTRKFLVLVMWQQVVAIIWEKLDSDLLI